MKGANNSPRTRRRKVDDETAIKPVRQKFVEEKQAKVYPLVAKTANQAKYIEMLKTKQLVYSVGASGSGKTFVACVHAVNRFLKGEVDRIVLIRPYESVGRSIGLRPGTTTEKLMPIMQSMLDPIRQILGNGQFEYALENGQIVMEALEDCRGRSYKRSVIVVDEGSNTDIKTMQTLVTRIDEGSQMIVCGDTKPWQQDIKGDSGLTFILNLIHSLRKETPSYLDGDDYAELTNNIGMVYFDRDDVVRSGLAKLFVKAFDEI
ncbi:PhoH [Rheinheimera phage vB_RspM_Barba30A]|uniref:PhoH-like protein n=1 Tax=Rheinheimera phage vB_RspM_Barba30A TaxID=2565681 RepID=A0A4P8NKB5_9CAUD|nr:PhoH [Rheinheimera phage vB_RspM_Barba30A]